MKIRPGLTDITKCRSLKSTSIRLFLSNFKTTYIRLLSFHPYPHIVILEIGKKNSVMTIVTIGLLKNCIPSLSSFTDRIFISGSSAGGHLVGMMLVRAIERSERILGAMKCRGFSGRLLLLQDFALTGRDRVFGAAMTALCLGLLLLETL